jgi:hypothetical protein
MEATSLALQGTLDVVSVADVLGLLAATAKTGRLRLESDAARGVVWVHDGQIAAVTGAEPRRETSVGEFLFWITITDGGWFRFELDHDVPDAAAGDPVNVEVVVAEVAALTHEWDELQRVVPSMGHRVGLVERLPGPTVTIDATVWPAVLAAATEPRVHDLGERFGLGDLDALRAVRDLVSTGVVEVRPPPGDGTRPHPAPAAPSAPVGARH